MEYKPFGDAYVARMDRGEEIRSQLEALCKKENIALASVSALGAVDHALVSVYDVPNKVFCRKEFNEPMEISALIGSVSQKEGQVYLHLHVTLCDTNCAAHGGHANELRVSATTEMILHTIPGTVERQLDPEIGLNLFKF
jgi:predicted DNA-binding protein with PD1-like motif